MRSAVRHSPGCAVAIGLAIALYTTAAHADTPINTDAGTLIADLCSSDVTEVLDSGQTLRFREFCRTALQRIANSPRQVMPAIYYQTKLGIRWCTPRADNETRVEGAPSPTTFEADSKAHEALRTVESASRLSQLYACGPRPMAMDLAGTRVGLVSSGLADFFFSYAVQEVIDYVVQDYIKALCRAPRDKDRISLAGLFSHTCTALFPGHTSKPPTYDAATLRLVKQALVQDLQGLARNAWEWLERSQKGQLKATVLAGLGLAISGAVEVAIGKTHPGDLLKKAAAYALERLAAPGNPYVCRLAPGADEWMDAQRARCLGLLAAQLIVSFDPDGVASSLDATAKEFCQKFGKPGTEQDAKCLLDGQSFVALNERLVKVARAFASVLDASAAVERAPKDRDAWGRVAAALSDAIAAFHDFVEVTQLDSSDTLRQAIDLATSLTSFGVALVGHDAGAMRTHLVAALQNELVDSPLAAKGVQIVTFLFSLYQAKDRSEVQELMKEIAAPIGSYRRKYGLSEQSSITVNGWVGGFFGYAARFHDKDETDGRAWGLAMPIGLDLQPHWLSGQRTRLSFGLTLIDPLGAAQLDESQDVPDAKLISIVNLGVHATLGLGRSPFVLRAAAEYRPGLQSEAMCGDERCYRGSALFTVGVAIDVPVLVLR